MDIRPLIHLWLNKPNVYSSGEYNTANMRPSVFHGDLATTSNGISRKVWGDDYSMLDAWLDIDRAIGKMGRLERDMFLTYVDTVLAKKGGNWESWPQPHILLQNYFTVIGYDILK